jgi:adenylate cyclase
MAAEIERKFLVAGEFPFDHSTTIVQGYLSLDPERIVRVRIESGCATLAIKGRTEGITNLEFEYEIPEADARILLRLSAGKLIEKTRYRRRSGVHTWEIDVYRGGNSGLVIAEIELDDELEQFHVPDWIGQEVSYDPRYRDANLALNPFENWARFTDGPPLSCRTNAL